MEEPGEKTVARACERYPQLKIATPEEDRANRFACFGMTATAACATFFVSDSIIGERCRRY